MIAIPSYRIKYFSAVLNSQGKIMGEKCPSNVDKQKVTVPYKNIKDLESIKDLSLSHLTQLLR